MYIICRLGAVICARIAGRSSRGGQGLGYLLGLFCAACFDVIDNIVSWLIRRVGTALPMPYASCQPTARSQKVS